MPKLTAGGGGDSDAEVDSDGDSDASVVGDAAERGLAALKSTWEVGIGIGAAVPATLSDYVDRDASLLGKVDFLGLIGDIGKGAFIAMLSIFTGLVVGSWRALGDLAGSIREVITMIVMAPVRGIQAVQREAVAAAGAQLDVFGLFALPTGTTVALLSVGATVFVVYIFIGGRLID